MQKLLPLAKKSAKEAFFRLRKNWPYFCGELESNIFVWKTFLNHIIFNNKKNRETRDLIERCLIVSFVEKIIKKWKITEKRNDRKSWSFYIKITIKNWKDDFSIITFQENEKYFLSCFLEYKRKNPS